MPNVIKQITLPVSGVATTYDIVDQGARDLIEQLQAYTDYLGVTTTPLSDGATTNPITIVGVVDPVTAKKGNIANSGSAEFIFNGSSWAEFGDLSGLGALAFKDSASASYTPAGTMTDPTITLGGTAEAAREHIRQTGRGHSETGRRLPEQQHLLL